MPPWNLETLGEVGMVNPCIPRPETALEPIVSTESAKDKQGFLRPAFVGEPRYDSSLVTSFAHRNDGPEDCCQLLQAWMPWHAAAPSRNDASWHWSRRNKERCCFRDDKSSCHQLQEIPE